MNLTDTELKQIEHAVKELESKTRGEIVPIVLSQSRDYLEPRLILVLMGILASGVSSYLLHEVWGAGWSLSLTSFALELVLGAAVGIILGFIPGLRRRLVGAESLAEAVDLRAAAEFTRHGVMNTSDRCGILLLVSLFEHRAEILADRGIHSQVPEGYWKSCLDRMMAQVKPQGLAAALCSGIAEIGELLAEKFPREAGTTNELSDHLRS